MAFNNWDPNIGNYFDPIDNAGLSSLRNSPFYSPSQAQLDSFGASGWYPRGYSARPFTPVQQGFDQAGGGLPANAPTSMSNPLQAFENDDWDPADRNSAQETRDSVRGMTPEEAMTGLMSAGKQYGPGIAKDLLGIAIGGPFGWAAGKIGSHALSMTEDPFGRNIIDRNIIDPMRGSFLGWSDTGDVGPGGWEGPSTAEDWAEEESTGGVQDDETDIDDFDTSADQDDADSPGGDGGNDEEDGEEEDGETNYRGGLITADKLRGPNPDGPDEGFASLQSGEYVLRKDAVDFYGQELLEALNGRQIPKKKISFLL